MLSAEQHFTAQQTGEEGARAERQQRHAPLQLQGAREERRNEELAAGEEGGGGTSARTAPFEECGGQEHSLRDC